MRRDLPRAQARRYPLYRHAQLHVAVDGPVQGTLQHRRGQRPHFTLYIQETAQVKPVELIYRTLFLIMV